MPHTYQYPRAALTVDCVVFGFDEGELKILLIERGLQPFKGRWALPGGFVRVEETLDEAARRELAEEAGLTNIFLEQLYTFGEVDRDPRERVLSVGLLVALNETQMAGRHRPAQLFRFDQKRYEQLRKQGFNFEL